MDERFSLAGRVALVTGASSGLGRHFALVLAKAGASVAVAARRTAPLATLAREIESIGGRALALSLDVTKTESVAAAVARAGELGSLQILVNNAGTVAGKAALELAKPDWDRVLETNLSGAFLVAQEAA